MNKPDREPDLVVYEAVIKRVWFEDYGDSWGQKNISECYEEESEVCYQEWQGPGAHRFDYKLEVERQ